MGLWSLLSQPNCLEPEKFVRYLSKTMGCGRNRTSFWSQTNIRSSPYVPAEVRASMFHNAGCGCTKVSGGGAPGAEIQLALCQPSPLQQSVSTSGVGEGVGTVFFKLMYTKTYRPLAVVVLHLVAEQL